MAHSTCSLHIVIVVLLTFGLCTFLSTSAKGIPSNGITRITPTRADHSAQEKVGHVADRRIYSVGRVLDIFRGLSHRIFGGGNKGEAGYGAPEPAYQEPAPSYGAPEAQKPEYGAPGYAAPDTPSPPAPAPRTTTASPPPPPPPPAPATPSPPPGPDPTPSHPIQPFLASEGLPQSAPKKVQGDIDSYGSPEAPVITEPKAIIEEEPEVIVATTEEATTEEATTEAATTEAATTEAATTVIVTTTEAATTVIVTTTEEATTVAPEVPSVELKEAAPAEPESSYNPPNEAGRDGRANVASFITPQENLFETNENKACVDKLPEGWNIECGTCAQAASAGECDSPWSKFNVCFGGQLAKNGNLKDDCRKSCNSCVETSDKESDKTTKLPLAATDDVEQDEQSTQAAQVATDDVEQDEQTTQAAQIVDVEQDEQPTQAAQIVLEEEPRGGEREASEPANFEGTWCIKPTGEIQGTIKGNIITWHNGAQEIIKFENNSLILSRGGEEFSAELTPEGLLKWNAPLDDVWTRVPGT